jgi:hypothetical protein
LGRLRKSAFKENLAILPNLRTRSSYGSAPSLEQRLLLIFGCDSIFRFVRYYELEQSNDAIQPETNPAGFSAVFGSHAR